MAQTTCELIINEVYSTIIKSVHITGVWGGQGLQNDIVCMIYEGSYKLGILLSLYSSLLEMDCCLFAGFFFLYLLISLHINLLISIINIFSIYQQKNSHHKRHSAQSVLLPRSRDRTVPFHSGYVSELTTQSSITPSVVTGVERSLDSKLLWTCVIIGKPQQLKYGEINHDGLVVLTGRNYVS